MWDIEKITNLLKETSKKFDDEFNIKVEISTTLRKTYGQCESRYKYKKWRPVSIIIRKSHLLENSDESIENTILHEWIHYYLTKSTGKRHGHNDLFRMYCKKLGLPPNRFTS